MSKREELREKRRKSQQRQRILTIAGIVIAALILVAVLVWPSINNATAPVGAIATIVPNPRPNADGLNMGDPNAPVKIEEFADFQCPGCRIFFTTLEKTIEDTYVKTGKAYFTYVPLSFIDDAVASSNESKHAAQAAYCASDQGKFWDYHDILFTNQSQTGENVGGFSDKRLVAFAQTLGLDMSKFNSCFSSGKYAQKVQQAAAYGIEKKVQQTPSFLVNGQLVGPNELVSTIDLAIAATK